MVLPGDASEEAVNALSGSLLSHPRPRGSAHDPATKKYRGFLV